MGKNNKTNPGRMGPPQHRWNTTRCQNTGQLETFPKYDAWFDYIEKDDGYNMTILLQDFVKKMTDEYRRLSSNQSPKDACTHNFMNGPLDPCAQKGAKMTIVNDPNATVDHVKMLHKLIVNRQLYGEHALCLTEQNRAEEFHFFEDLDLLIPDEIMMNEINKMDEIASKNGMKGWKPWKEKSPEDQHKTCMNIVTSLEKLWLETFLVMHSCAFGYLKQSALNRRNTEVTVYTASGFAGTKQKYKISFHFVYKNIVLFKGTEDSKMIREFLVRFAERYKDMFMPDKLRQVWPSRTVNFTEVIDKTSGLADSFRIPFCDKGDNNAKWRSPTGAMSERIFTSNNLPPRIERRPLMPIGTFVLVHTDRTIQCAEKTPYVVSVRKFETKVANWLEKYGSIEKTPYAEKEAELLHWIQCALVNENKSTSEAQKFYNGPRRLEPHQMTFLDQHPRDNFIPQCEYRAELAEELRGELRECQIFRNVHCYQNNFYWCHLRSVEEYFQKLIKTPPRQPIIDNYNNPMQQQQQMQQQMQQQQAMVQQQQMQIPRSGPAPGMMGGGAPTPQNPTAPQWNNSREQQNNNHGFNGYGPGSASDGRYGYDPSVGDRSVGPSPGYHEGPDRFYDAVGEFDNYNNNYIEQQQQHVEQKIVEQKNPLINGVGTRPPPPLPPAKNLNRQQPPPLPPVPTTQGDMNFPPPNDFHNQHEPPNNNYSGNNNNRSTTSNNYNNQDSYNPGEQQFVPQAGADQHQQYHGDQSIPPPPPMDNASYDASYDSYNNAAAAAYQHRGEPPALPYHNYEQGGAPGMQYGEGNPPPPPAPHYLESGHYLDSDQMRQEHYYMEGVPPPPPEFPRVNHGQNSQNSLEENGSERSCSAYGPPGLDGIPVDSDPMEPIPAGFSYFNNMQNEDTRGAPKRMKNRKKKDLAQTNLLEESPPTAEPNEYWNGRGGNNNLMPNNNQYYNSMMAENNNNNKNGNNFDNGWEALEKPGWVN